MSTATDIEGRRKVSTHARWFMRFTLPAFVQALARFVEGALRSAFWLVVFVVMMSVIFAIVDAMPRSFIGLLFVLWLVCACSRSAGSR